MAEVATLPLPFLRVMMTAMVAALVVACSSDSSPEPLTESGLRSLLIGAGGPEAAALMARDRLVVEESIVACMAEEGFEYFVPSAIVEQPPLREVYASAEYIERYGLGISTQQFRQGGLPDGLIGYDESNDAVWEEDDGNAGYVDALDDATAAAYYEALNGSIGSSGDERRGCRRRALLEAPSAGAVLASLSEQQAKMEEAIAADERMVRFEQEALACLAEQGFDLASLDDPIEDFESRIDMLAAEVSYEGDRLIFGVEAEAELQALQDEELLMAAQYERCNAIGEGRVDSVSEIRADHVDRFLDANHHLLEPHLT